MSGKTASRAAWSLWAVAPVAVVASVVIGVVTDTLRADGPFIVLIPVFLLAFATVGALVASRHPGNAIGWIFLATSLAWSLLTVTDSIATHAAIKGATGTTIARVSDWVNLWFYMPGVFLPFTLVLLLFPDGRLPSRRWWPVSWVAVLANTGGALAGAFGPVSTLEDTRFLRENPFAIEAVAPVLVPVGAASWLLGAVSVLASITALVVRFRRSHGDERQQTTWVVFVGVVAVTALVGQGIAGAMTGWDGPVAQVLFPAIVLIALTLIPLAAGIAILKHRLYDIDVVVNKALVYGALAGLVTAIYLAIVVGVGTWAGGAGPFLSAVAAAVVALLFQPARRWAQHLANQIVYGRRATPYQVLAGFSERLAAAYSLEDVLPRVAKVLGEGIGADRVRVVLGEGSEAVPVAVWPVRPTSDDPRYRSFEVRHQGEPLGAIQVTMPANEPLPPASERLIQHVAAQAGLVLRNVRLLEDLRESRRRIVAAQDERAKKLERDIHDGAQQQLVALQVKQRLADAMVDRDPTKAHELLDEIQRETVAALDELRDLARGIYPPLLADQGLAPALGAQARKSSVPVTIEADGIGRYTQETEAAVYFSCLEALQNVAKYAGATSTTVRLVQRDGALTFEVSDDGRGFDPAVVAHGTGLQGIADRLAAIGGELTVRSAPGDGTTLTGRLPVGEAR